MGRGTRGRKYAYGSTQKYDPESGIAVDGATLGDLRRDLRKKGVKATRDETRRLFEEERRCGDDEHETLCVLPGPQGFLPSCVPLRPISEGVLPLEPSTDGPACATCASAMASLPNNADGHVVQRYELWKIPTGGRRGRPHQVAWEVVVGTPGAHGVTMHPPSAVEELPIHVSSPSPQLCQQDAPSPFALLPKRSGPPQGAQRRGFDITSVKKVAIKRRITRDATSSSLPPADQTSTYTGETWLEVVQTNGELRRVGMNDESRLRELAALLGFHLQPANALLATETSEADGEGGRWVDFVPRRLMAYTFENYSPTAGARAPASGCIDTTVSDWLSLSASSVLADAYPPVHFASQQVRDGVCTRNVVSAWPPAPGGRKLEPLEIDVAWHSMRPTDSTLDTFVLELERPARRDRSAYTLVTSGSRVYLDKSTAAGALVMRAQTNVAAEPLLVIHPPATIY